MPRPCWNFWGPYWPHQPCLRSSKNGGLRGPERAPRLLRSFTPPLPCQSRSGSPMGLPAICASVKSNTDFFFLPSFTRCPRGYLSSLPPSYPSSSSLPFRPRNVGENPRRLARIFLGLYYYCRGSTQMVSSTGRFVRSAERGFIFPSPCVQPILRFSFSRLFLFLLRHHEGRTT